MIDQLIGGRTDTTDIHCRLTPTGLEVQGAGRQRKLIPYATIREVNLQSLGLPGGAARFRCTIRSWEHPRLSLDSIGFKGQTDHDAGNVAYRHFVARLHRILKHQGVTCRFTRGSAGLIVAGWCLLSVILLASSASLLSLGLRGLWVALCMSPGIPYGIYLIHNSRCEDYAPDDLPAELLPEVDAQGHRAPSGRDSRRKAEVAC
jgi:hypothetical protein